MAVQDHFTESKPKKNYKCTGPWAMTGKILSGLVKILDISQ